MPSSDDPDRSSSDDPALFPAGSRTRRSRTKSPEPGLPCGDHLLNAPESDTALQAVHHKLNQYGDLSIIFGRAVYESIQYVLDGSRTWRFDLNQSEVDRDERASVGTKLQYRLIEHLMLTKLPPLDVIIANKPVDIKATVRDNWSIPEEAFCQICILVQISAKDDAHQSWLMRTHRAWLYSGTGNRDKKRGVQTDALNRFAIPLYPRSGLPVNPLKRLTSSQRTVVFDLKQGQEFRLLKLFEYLPNTVISRDVILTVCAQRKDPLRRARAIKDKAQENGIELLVGTWTADAERAKSLGFDLTGEAWVGVVKPNRQPAARDKINQPSDETGTESSSTLF